MYRRRRMRRRRGVKPLRRRVKLTRGGRRF